MNPDDVIRQIDSADFADRVRRYARLASTLPDRNQFPHAYHGGFVTEELLGDAERAFLYGANHSSLLAAECFCRRELLSLLFADQDVVTATFNDATTVALDRGHIDHELKVRLDLLSDRAAGLGFNPDEGPLGDRERRMAELDMTNDPRTEQNVAEDDAYESIETALTLLLLLNGADPSGPVKEVD